MVRHEGAPSRGCGKPDSDPARQGDIGTDSHCDRGSDRGESPVLHEQAGSQNTRFGARHDGSSMSSPRADPGCSKPYQTQLRPRNLVQRGVGGDCRRPFSAVGRFPPSAAGAWGDVAVFPGRGRRLWCRRPACTCSRDPPQADTTRLAVFPDRTARPAVADSHAICQITPAPRLCWLVHPREVCS